MISSGTQSDVWVYDVARDAFSKLTFEGDDQTAVWSPDGRDIAFTSDRALGLVTSPGGSPATIRGVYLKRADGSGPPRLLFKLAGTLGVTGFSPDGRMLAFQVTKPETQLDRRRDPAAGTARPTDEPSIVVAGPANEGSGVFSPDGRWLAYDSTDGGLGYIFVRSAAGGDAKWQVSDEMGFEPSLDPGRDPVFPAPRRIDRGDPRHRGGRRARLREGGSALPRSSRTTSAAGSRWDGTSHRTASGSSSSCARGPRPASRRTT